MPTILLLDGARRRLPDEPTWLRRSDWSLRDAATADEALRAVAAHTPALVIVDFERNPETALEAVRALRADPAGRDIPLLVLAPPHRADEALRAGAGHVFTAEASPEVVLAQVGRSLDLLEGAVRRPLFPPPAERAPPHREVSRTARAPRRLPNVGNGRTPPERLRRTDTLGGSLLGEQVTRSGEKLAERPRSQ